MKIQFGLKSFVPLALLLFFPILARLPLFMGIFDSDPLLYYSGLASNMKRGPLLGEPTIDPNIGFTSHALGHRAAEMLLSGRMPWWNPFEGIGMPLAGEMQSGALFPLTLLQILPGGQLIEHITLQIIAGLFTYGLLRSLKVQPMAAFASATAYEFNGVFAWLGNAVCNPVPFLPMLLYGIERSVSGARRDHRRGHVVIAFAVAASLYAGFPEVAYLNGLFAAAWSITRIAQLPRFQAFRFAGTLGLGAAGGALLAAPIIISFLDFLPYSSLGAHSSTAISSQHLAPIAAAAIPMPYIFGTIFSPFSAWSFWDRVGGYSGCTLLVLAVAGLFVSRERTILRFAGLWTFGCFLISFGAVDGAWLGLVVPGTRYVWLVRYLPPSWLFCMTILGAFSLSELLSSPRPFPLLVGLGALATMVALPLIFAHHDPKPLPNQRAIIICLASVFFTICLTVAAFVRKPNQIMTIAACLLVAESIILFEIPMLSNPRHGYVDIAGIAYLKNHIGLNRVASLGPIAANYGTYFGLASINYNDIPAYQPWTQYVVKNLDRNTDPVSFDGIARLNSHGTSSLSEIEKNLAGYAGVGVRFVVVQHGRGVPNMRKAYVGSAMDIYEVPSPASYFEAPGCTVTARSRETVVTHCLEPARLIRREAWMPGWKASLNGQKYDVDRYQTIFQSISVPKGSAQVYFSYEPPFMLWGWVAAGIGLGVLAVASFAAGCKPAHTN